jgi:hypothetical protein
MDIQPVGQSPSIEILQVENEAKPHSMLKSVLIIVFILISVFTILFLIYRNGQSIYADGI